MAFLGPEMSSGGWVFAKIKRARNPWRSGDDDEGKTCREEDWRAKKDQRTRNESWRGTTRSKLLIFFSNF